MIQRVTHDEPGDRLGGCGGKKASPGSDVCVMGQDCWGGRGSGETPGGSKTTHGTSEDQKWGG